MEESVVSEHQDRLSELPESLIHLIFSFLPMRDVVSTNLLSKRWNNLWTTVPYLIFYDELENENGNDRVRNFVNRALMFWRGNKILKFIIHIENLFDLSLASDLDLWVRFAVEFGVEELRVRLRYNDIVLNWKDDPLMEDVYWAPQCLNSCSSITKLSLVGCNLRIDGCPAWNHLKSLEFRGFCFGESLANRVLLGSPRLEVFDLTYFEIFENLNIWSTSLKTLKIRKVMYHVEGTPTDMSHTLLRICCPNLETLEVSGVLYGKYLVTEVSSLTDVTIGFFPDPIFYGEKRGSELLGETLRQLLPTIQHVESLDLSSICCFQGLVALAKKCLLSPFPNVKFLKLQIDNFECDDLIKFLDIFPSLKMLAVDFVPTIAGSPEFNIEKFAETEYNSPNPTRLLKTIRVRYFTTIA